MKVGLKDLISGIYSSVVRARRFVNDQHLQLFEEHFTETREGDETVFVPKTVKIRVPHEGREDTVIKAPLAALMPTSTLGVKTLEMEFEASLVNFDNNDLPPNEGEGVKLPAANIPSEVQVVLKKRCFWSRTPEAKFKITFELRDAPEGVSLIEERLLDSMR